MIDFQECISYGKTKIFDVVHGEVTLGQIRWCRETRGYAVFPEAVIPDGLMYAIKNKISELTEEHKAIRS